METWKDIELFNSKYEISNTGLVRNKMNGNFISGEIIRKGYRRVTLSHLGKTKKILVHRLVAEYFIGKSDLQVNHIDLDKLNNNFLNLEYVTSRENKAHYCLSTIRKLPIGVRKMRNKFQARLNVKDKTIYLGVFETPLLASEAYNKALNGL